MEELNNLNVGEYCSGKQQFTTFVGVLQEREATRTLLLRHMLQ